MANSLCSADILSAALSLILYLRVSNSRLLHYILVLYKYSLDLCPLQYWFSAVLIQFRKEA